MPGMADEIEMKFHVPDLRAIRRALQRAGATYLGSAVQSDEYFDTPDGRLLGADCGLRLRRVRLLRRGGKAACDTRPVLTFKGPADRTRRAKVRREVQARLDNADAVAEILAAAGFRRTVLIEKRRVSYRLAGCLVELDELPLLGTFVEIEGAGQKPLTLLAARLGLSGEPIRDHYITLLRRRCRRVGARCATVTRKGCPGCRHRPRRNTKSEIRNSKSDAEGAP